MNYIVYLILAQKLYNIIFMWKWLQDLKWDVNSSLTGFKSYIGKFFDGKNKHLGNIDKNMFVKSEWRN